LSVAALKFLILTAARRSEVVGATWSEIDFQERLLTTPAERMKSVRQHRVPLSTAAIDLLKSLPTEEGNLYLFIGARQEALSDAAMMQTLRRIGRRETAHGFRSSFSDWAHETTSFANHAIELSLASAMKPRRHTGVAICSTRDGS
jgi:integrase